MADQLLIQFAETTPLVHRRQVVAAAGARWVEQIEPQQIVVACCEPGVDPMAVLAQLRRRDDVVHVERDRGAQLFRE